MLVIPNLPLMLVLAAFIGQADPFVIAAIIGLSSWGWGAPPSVRAQTLSLRRRDYVLASELLGEPAWRIIAVRAAAQPRLDHRLQLHRQRALCADHRSDAGIPRAGAILSAVSWGTMLYHARTTSALMVGAWWEVAAPSLALVVFGSALSLINFGLDEIANPRLRTPPRAASHPRHPCPIGPSA